MRSRYDVLLERAKRRELSPNERYELRQIEDAQAALVTLTPEGTSPLAS